MTKEEKEILYKELCLRLPYNTQIYFNIIEPQTPVRLTIPIINCLKTIPLHNDDIVMKPYLRPLSSMTESECTQLAMLLPKYYLIFPDSICLSNTISNKLLPEHIEIITDFYNSHHFDWRGLISKGLAIEAPEDMYK